MNNPFKDYKELTRDIESYLKRNNRTIFEQSKRISDFFEMACYNNIVRFYENTGHIVSIKNTQKNKFRYKCTTAGDPNNYSYFEIKSKKKGGNIFEIRHNVNVQSFHKNDIYTTPDIVIVKENCLSVDPLFYSSKTQYYFIPNDSLISFCECKNLNAFPELLFNFIGVVNN